MKMKQREVNFEAKSYLTKSDYYEDGCPVQYFEFTEHECYGLVAVRKDFSLMSRREWATAKTGQEAAFEVYAEEVAGIDVEDVRNEGYPRLISKSEALLKFLLAEDNAKESVEELINQFNDIQNGTILIDSSLM